MPLVVQAVAEQVQPQVRHQHQAVAVRAQLTVLRADLLKTERQIPAAVVVVALQVWEMAAVAVLAL
jgi:hypothetical protein